MPRDSHGHPAKQWCCWLLTGTAYRSPHVPPQFPRLAEEREAMENVVLLQGSYQIPWPHTVNACRRFEERSSAKATDNPPSCSFLNCPCHAITFLQLIHQHPLLPVFRRCTLFFLLGYWWPFHNPLWPTLVCHSQIMRASIAWKNKFCLQAMPIKSSISLDQERRSLSVYPECIPQSTQLNNSVPLIFYALGAIFYIHIIVSIILCSALVPHTPRTN